MSLLLLRRALRKRSRHVAPFLVLGDPTPEISLELAKAAVGDGATMLELGIPYDAACADGPDIQAADARALAAGVGTEAALRLLARIREACPGAPLNLLVYGNLVHARGWARFAADAAAAGASSLLVPDIPLEEGAPLRAASKAAGLGVVMMAGPRTDAARLLRIAAAADAFVYLAGRQGTTGVNAAGEATAPEFVAAVVAAIRRPVCLGFGLVSPAQVAAAFGAGARIAVVGSLLARTIGPAWEGGGADAPARVLDRFRTVLAPMIAAAAP